MGAKGTNILREFECRGETFRVTAHGIAGHEEILIVHIEADGAEGGETSTDRMTEENDTSAPLEDIINIQFDVHNGVQNLAHD